MHFIHEDMLDNIGLCDDIVSVFHAGKAAGLTLPGSTGYGVDAAWKKSTDMTIPPELADVYFDELIKISGRYTTKFPMMDNYEKWGISEPCNIQHYAPNEGFLKWHTERPNARHPCNSRVLVFMTYLNDVYDGGGTEFLHQEITTTARKGKTLIWPADWTYTHRGQVSPTEDKYIVTGWFNYLA